MKGKPCIEICNESCCNRQDKSLEAEASDALGAVYQLMADNETALQVCADSLYNIRHFNVYLDIL